ncbi:MAG: hypothetical protein QXS48_01435 [Candidatus Aenigmatarchaeota archaeon]
MMISKEYQEFLKSVKPQLSLYEKACNFAEKILKVRASKETEQRFESAIRFCYLNISPSGPVSLVTVLFLIVFPVLIVLLLLGLINAIALAGLIFLFLFFLFYLYNYPFLKVKVIRARASTEMILATLYMAVALRETSNLENAVRFAAENSRGVIGLDLKKIIWDLETQRYFSVDDALDDFLEKWGKENEEFVETVKILQSSTSQLGEQRLALIDEAIDVLLNGTVERMKHYALGLRMPVMLIYSLGIILPVIALIIFPIVMIFMQGIFNVWFLILGYDVALPLLLYWLMNQTLERKPPATSQPQIKGSAHSLVIEIGKNKIEISVLTIIFPILLAFLIFGAPMLYHYTTLSSLCREWQVVGFNASKPKGLELSSDECKKVITDTLTPTISSSSIILGIGISIGFACLLVSQPKLKLREKVKNLEREFREALFQLGHQIKSGHSIEFALEKAKLNLKKMEIANFYEKIIRNIKLFGLTFEKSVFDEKIGAIKAYPSDLIYSVMKIIVDASRKGYNAVATSSLTISRYLKGMHQVEEQIQEILSEAATSMKFLGFFLAPLVAGVTVAMAVIVINILAILSLQFGSMSNVEVPGSASFLLKLWRGGIGISPDIFQLVLGIYVIETSFLIGMFVNGIENGEDRVGEVNLIGKITLVSTIVYVIVLFVTYLVFGDILKVLLLGAPR